MKVPENAAFAAQKGAPPTLEWIAVDRLAIDEAYQRATDGSKSRSLIFSIAREWNWCLCQPLVVARRVDGALFVIDGQHRLSAAIRRGDIPHLPCVVIAGASAADEAATFVALNTKRQRLSQADIFNAMLAAGDASAAATATLMEETGWKQIRGNGPREAGQLVCGPMIAREIDRIGSAHVRNALATLSEAYPTTAVPNTSVLLKGLFAVFRHQPPADPDLFVEALASVGPTDWELEAADVRAHSPALSRVESFAEAFLLEYRELLAGQAVANG